MNKVSIRYCEDYSESEVSQSLNKCLNDIGGLSKYIKQGDRVMLKCNISKNYTPDMALTTHPSIVIALSEEIEKLGASCIVVDSPKSPTDKMDKIYETTQMLSASNYGHAVLNNNMRVFSVDFDGEMTKSLTLLDVLNEVDYIIDLPKFIIDKDLGLVAGAENLFGIVPSEMQKILNNRLFTTRDRNNFILDLYSYIKDKVILTIVDGVVAREDNENQRIMNALIAGDNLFAVENVCLQLANQNPTDSILLNLADNRKLYNLTEKIELIGDKLEDFLKNDFSHLNNEISGEKSLVKENKRQSKYNSYQRRPSIMLDKCKGCKRCIEVCPTKAIAECKDKNNEIYAKIDYSKCINCLKCIHNCPYSAIKTITPHKFKVLNSRLEKRSK